MVCTDCLGRTPFPSIVATIILCLGVGLFCGTLFRALDITLNGIFIGLFWFNVPWLETIQIVFIVIASVMGIYALILLVFGILATGATREQVYSGANCIFGGRVSAVFGMTALCAVPIIIYVMLNSICVHEYIGTPPWELTQENCLNLSRFDTDNVNSSSMLDPNLELGAEVFGVLCDTTFALTLAENYIKIQSTKELTSYKQVGFLITLTANYNKIKMSKELTEYREAADLELTETTIYEGTHPRRQY
ncbi:hypothetical protein LSH36_14g12008 [Paralvinella palmiformis]|uniref:Uncharacterized protein n=1 Tax=Paralvinella palmiformis TaxID=53620 RepID=A0AAD9NIW7_9ANNE|nr:hypothetical protein LSH36_14g12008 [Paralvinella palmiformis]